MNESLKNRISEVIGANNISYILNDNKDFSVTGYKVMQNQGSNGLLRCAKIMYNGKIKLVYIIGANKPLSHVATRLGVNELNAVVFNLIQRAMDIKANGFFRAENLELDFNKIFVDISDYSVHLIYFPIAGGATGKITGFENEFRVALINLFNSFPVFNAPQFQKLCSDLANGSMPLELILKKLQDNVNGGTFSQKGFDNIPKGDYPSGRVAKIPATPVNPVNPVTPVYGGYGNNQYPNNGYGGYGNEYPNGGYNAVQTPQPLMTLTAINSPVHTVLSVEIPEYLIGKNPNAVNGAVTYNPAISRVHCKITYSQGHYYITDMASANGTFVNGRRLDTNATCEIRNGDCIKLANSDFMISF